MKNYLILLLLFTPTLIIAEDYICRRKLEPWYHMISAGSQLKIWRNNQSQPFKSAMNIYPIHLYWRIKTRLLFGIGISGSLSEGPENELDSASLFLSFTSQYYFHSIGNGVFLMGDIGIGRIYIGDNLGDYGHELFGERSFIYQIGLGYAWPISKSTSILGFLFYKTIVTEYEYFRTISELSFSIGLLM